MKAPFNYRPGRFGYRRPPVPRLNVAAAATPASPDAAPRPLLPPEPLSALPKVA